MKNAIDFFRRPAPSNWGANNPMRVLSAWARLGALLLLAAAPSAAWAQSSDATLFGVQLYSSKSSDENIASLDFEISGSPSCTILDTHTTCSGGVRESSVIVVTPASGAIYLVIESNEDGASGVMTVPAQVASSLPSVRETNVVNNYDRTSAVQLSPGRPRKITIEVTAPDGVTTLTYRVIVSNGQPTFRDNANLRDLSLSGDAVLSPQFDAATTSYAASVANSIGGVSVTPAADDFLAAVTVDGTAVAEGASSAEIALVAGVPKDILVVITAQDAMTMKTYTVTAHRGEAANANADLTGLSVSGGAVLSPQFDAATTSYAAVVNVRGITVTPTASDSNALVTVDGVAVASGAQSGEIALEHNTPKNILVVITAADGTTIKTYTVTVTSIPSSNADLRLLLLSGNAVFSDSFSSEKTEYTADVLGNVGAVRVTPFADDSTAVIRVEGAVVASSAQSGEIALTAGVRKTISVVVTAQDGTTVKTYTVRVRRGLFSNADLRGLSLLGADGAALSPEFDAATTSYRVTVQNSISRIRVAPQGREPDTRVNVDGARISVGTASGEIALVAGVPKDILVVVTAQDGTTTKTYTVTVRRLSDNANLAALTLSGGAVLSPSFNAATTSYTATVAHNISGVTVTPTLSDSNAAVTVDGAAVASGAASGEIALVVGVPKDILVVVTAQDGTTTKTYTVTVLRSENADLSALTLSGGAVLSPQFDAATVAYTASVNNNVGGLTFTPTTDDSNASVTVDGTAVASGAGSGEIALVAGVPKAVLVVVTAQDGTTTKTYTVTVTRLSNNANLAALTLSGGAVLSPQFDAATVAYTASVNNNVGGLTFTPTTDDSNASVTVDGTAVASGAASGEIALVVNVPKDILVVVTAQDGTTTKTYTVTVTRSSLRFPAAQEDLTVRAGAPLPAPIALGAAEGGVPPLIYAVSNLPGGLSFNANRREISGTPSAAGEARVVYSVTDAAAARAETQFTIRAVTFDLDLDAATAETPQDGIIIARYLLGVRGELLVRGQSAAGNAAAFAAEIQKGVDSKALDVDADGEAGFADGIFIARYTLGLRGDDLVRGFDNKDAAEITGNIQNLRP